MNGSKHKHLDSKIKELYLSGVSQKKVGEILSLSHSTIGYRIKILGLSRSISESLVGRAKSKAHRKALSKSRKIREVAKGSKNPNWRGGVSSESELKISAIKNSFEYKEWKRAVKGIGYCEACGTKENLEAHHVLPKSKFPHLIHDIKNGKCLCKDCHRAAHRGAEFHSGELLETLTVNDEGNQHPSSQSEKVQRLSEHSDVLNNRLERPTRKR